MTANALGDLLFALAAGLLLIAAGMNEIKQEENEE